MFHSKNMRVIAIFALFFLCALSTLAQRVRGELHLEVHDPHGTAVSPIGELVSEANGFRRTFVAGPEGRYVAQDLPFGVYRLSLQAEGFAPWSDLVEIRSEVPVRVAVTLGVAPVTTKVEVNDSATLVDPYAAATVYSIGRQSIEEHNAAQPGRELLDLVSEEPGWVFEANGVLHPRGSEYDVQFVVDGLPLTQNRSPAFAPPFETGDVDSMRVMTAGFPAEYGRKLGGVVEITSPKNAPNGLHGEFDAEGGSFSTGSAHAALFYANGANRFSVSGDGFHTERYLDPPVLGNFTNRGNAGGFSTSYERDFSSSDRLLITVTQHSVHYLVPNELVQQQAGQREDAAQMETSGQLRYTHTFSPELLFSVAGSVRDATALLSSNAQSTPVIVSQDRGYREGYVRADLAGHHGKHEWKIGADGIFSPVHESLWYQITDAAQFDPGTRPSFQFSDRRWDIEPSAYAQDQIRLGHWNVSAGLRFDHYGFAVNESAWSPRIGISRFIPSLNLLLHGSYDRVFQTPAMENLLLASSPQLDSLSSLVLRIPVRPGRTNYYEVGFTKSLAGNLRIDGNVFRRDFRNLPDDDTLLDTGISFPIAFSTARIYGEEVQIGVPNWGRFSGFVSYSNQTGVGQGPLSGGLFLGDKAASASNTIRFPISQDQRNTVRARVRFQAVQQLWFAASAGYGSGLPVNLDQPIDYSNALAQYGASILNKVNFGAGRVRPNFSLDAAAGGRRFHKETREISMQVEANNLTNRVNVLNFASLFSGTAVAPPRSVSARLKLSF